MSVSIARPPGNALLPSMAMPRIAPPYSLGAGMVNPPDVLGGGRRLVCWEEGCGWLSTSAIDSSATVRTIRSVAVVCPLFTFFSGGLALFNSFFLFWGRFGVRVF